MKLPAPKTCGCGIVHTEVGESGRYDPDLEMYYWECACRSTLVYMPDLDSTKTLARKLAQKSKALATA